MHLDYNSLNASMLAGPPSQLEAALAAGNPLMSPEQRAQRIMRNYGGRTVSPRGGQFSRFATATGDLPLPRSQCLDTMGYACERGSQATEFDFMTPEVYDAPVNLGQAASETPEVTTLPWKVDQPAAGPSFWEKAGVTIGVVGGVLGIVLSLRALRARQGKSGGLFGL